MNRRLQTSLKSFGDAAQRAEIDKFSHKDSMPNHRLCWLLVLVTLGVHVIVWAQSSVAPAIGSDDGATSGVSTGVGAEVASAVAIVASESPRSNTPKRHVNSSNAADTSTCNAHDALVRRLKARSTTLRPNRHAAHKQPTTASYYENMREPPLEAERRSDLRRELLEATVAAAACRGGASRRKLDDADTFEDYSAGGEVGAWDRIVGNAKGAPVAASSTQKLNVLMVILDDLRPDLALYGHTRAPPTPRLDAFATSARVFRRAYSQFPDCAPSRSSFLTGMRPDHLGIDSHDCTSMDWTQVEGLQCQIRSAFPGVVSLPEHFRERGYLSLSYGKVFHQGLDDDSWSNQSVWPDGYQRGPVNDTWKQRKWKYEEWNDPAHKRQACGPYLHAQNNQSCFLEEHYNGHLFEYTVRSFSLLLVPFSRWAAVILQPLTAAALLLLLRRRLWRPPLRARFLFCF